MQGPAVSVQLRHITAPSQASTTDVLVDGGLVHVEHLRKVGDQCAGLVALEERHVLLRRQAAEAPDGAASQQTGRV